MYHASIRLPAALLAATATIATLAGIATLADVPARSAMPLVVLPETVVTASARDLLAATCRASDPDAFRTERRQNCTNDVR